MGLIEHPPRGWGEDKLSEFIEFTWQNVLATFQKMPAQYRVFRKIDDQFNTATDNLKNPAEPLGAIFLLRCHSVFRASLRLALSGQLPEAYMLLRGTLETALYALLLTDRPTLGPIWIARHESDEARRQVREAFRIGAMFDLLTAKDARLAGTVRQLYDRTIDFGGHPNERAIITNLQRSETEDTVTFETIYATKLDTVWARGCLKTSAETGVASLKMFEFIFKERFQLLGVSDFLAKFRPVSE